MRIIAPLFASLTMTLLLISIGAPCVANAKDPEAIAPQTSQQISEDRLLSTLREFGEVFAAVRLGRRFETVTLFTSDSHKESAVQYTENPVPTVKSLVAELFTQLGARAMEKVLLSPKPLEMSATLAITGRSAGDIRQATQILYNVLFEYGLDPFAGVIDYRGMGKKGKYANFADIPPEKIDALSFILRDVEGYVVRDLLNAFPREWYVEKIAQMAQGKEFTEAQVYELLEFPYPGKNALPIGETSALSKIFGDILTPVPAEVAEAKAFKMGLTQTTAAQNLLLAIQFFVSSLQYRMHGETIPHPDLPAKKRIGFDPADAVVPPKGSATRAGACEDFFFWKV